MVQVEANFQRRTLHHRLRFGRQRHRADVDEGVAPPTSANCLRQRQNVAVETDSAWQNDLIC
ncbi:hypothetical protein OMK73_01905 [Cupriavidus sp. D39]|nr:hypothetical protein [Cupriavidus sp. D39]MCY0852745.1 hypothetical protein [Cupriavidus sp. D39]